MVEDNQSDLQTSIDTLERYKSQKNRNIEMISSKSIEEAFSLLDNTFDGAIIDMKLSDKGGEGNQVIRKIAESNIRIPIVVFTGTPSVADAGNAYIEVCKKGENTYEEIFDRLWGIHCSGLTRIMGGRGIIESTLNQVYKENILSQKDAWVNYGVVDSEKTEKSLLRYTLNHLLELIDENEKSYPEEYFINPPVRKGLTTGSLVLNVKDNKWFVVLNPACDLVLRPDGKFKTDKLFLVEIENEENVIATALGDNNNNPTSNKAIKSHNKKLSDIFKNNHTPYNHWVPKTTFFSGGFLNFRSVLTCDTVTFIEKFSDPKSQISQPFIKDVVSRFSSYYARQGQPDIDFYSRLKSAD